MTGDKPNTRVVQRLSPAAARGAHGSAADVARDGLTASTLCVLAVKAPLEGGVRSCRSAACIGPAQALPSIVQAFPKLLRPLAACRAAPTSGVSMATGFRGH